METVTHQIALHTQIIGQGHMAGAVYLLQHHMEHKRRALAQGFYTGIGPVAVQIG